MSCSPSLTASPADSWPRCWRANSPSAATAPASAPPASNEAGRTAPKMPHMSAVLRTGSGTPAEGPGQPLVPGVAEVGDGHVQGVGDPRPALLGRAGRAVAGQLDDQTLTAHHTKRLNRQAELAGQQHERRRVPRPGRDHEPGRALAEQLDRGRPADRQPEARAEPTPDR